MTPTCMTADELELWLANDVRGGSSTPCIDCPLMFASEMRAAGCCNGEPRDVAPPSLNLDFAPVAYVKYESHRVGKTWGYATEAERIAARRQSWRDSRRRRALARARATCDNGNAGTSSDHIDSRTDAVPLLVPSGAASLRPRQGLDA